MAETKKTGMGWVIIGSLVAVGAGIAVAVANSNKPVTPPPEPPPEGGAVNFTIKIINLPPEANQWGCAFQDPATGEYSQPTNRPVMGSHLFDPSESAQLSPPVSAGVLSISAFAQVSVTMANQIVNYQISLSVAEGSTYTFDFSTGKIV
jgi:hypothetical protein